jgi:DNA-binding response OmpR family regulator
MIIENLPGYARRQVPPSPVVLLAEDNAEDAFLLRRAFARAHFGGDLMEVSDGAQARHYLSGDPPYDDRERFPLPRLVIVDLNLTGQEGFDLLSWMTTRPELQGVRTVMVSGSSEESDVARARHLGVRDYQVKPSDFTGFVRLARDLQTKWLNWPTPPDA